MRSFFWLWVMFLLVCIVTDSAAYWVTRYRLGQSLELALDSALVAGLAESDLSWGRNQVDQARGAAWAEAVFLRNMAGHQPANLSFSWELGQEEERIVATGVASARLPFLLAGMVGRQDGVITINKTLYYQGQYK